MSSNPAVQTIYRGLHRAREETRVVLPVGDRAVIVGMNAVESPQDCWAARRAMDHYPDERTWTTDGPGFEGFLEWVGIHWNALKEMLAPGGTIRTQDRRGRSGEAPLDAIAATRKLRRSGGADFGGS